MSTRALCIRWPPCPPPSSCAPACSGRPPTVLFGWLGPLFVAAVGGILRFWNLGDPHQLVFDETYYVKQGWSMLLFGVEMRNDPVLNEAKQIDQNFTAGNVLKVYDPTTGDLVVHPPVGKWLIGWGEQLFGIDNSFGWRFAVCVMGVLSILMIGRAARRLFGSSLLGTVAALLLAFEGHHFVHSRTGLLDLILMFWAFAAFCFLLIDRDQSRKILARKVAGLDRAGLAALGPWGPSTGLASVAARRGGMPRAGLRDQVVRRLLPRRLRADDGPAGTWAPAAPSASPAGRPRGWSRTRRWRCSGWSAPPSSSTASAGGAGSRPRSATTATGPTPTPRTPAGCPDPSGRGGTTTPRSSSSTPT